MAGVETGRTLREHGDPQRVRNHRLVLSLGLLLAASGSAQEPPADKPEVEQSYVVVTTPFDSSPLRLSQKYLSSPDYWAQLAELNLLRAGTAIRVPEEMLRPDRIRAKVVSFRGEVEIARYFDRRDREEHGQFVENAPSIWMGVVDDLLVQQGDRLRTGPDSSVVVRQDDGSEIRLNEESTLWVSENRNEGSRRLTRLVLKRGSLSSRVHLPTPEDRFEVSSSSTTAVILGTEFRFRLTPEGNPRLEVLTGEVALETGDGRPPVRIRENQGFLVQAESPAGAPRHLPATPDSLVFVGDGLIGGFEPDVLLWEPVADAMEYELELATDPGFEDIAGRWRVGAPKSDMNPENIPLETGAYYVRVSSIDVAGYQSAPSKPQALSYRN